MRPVGFALPSFVALAFFACGHQIDADSAAPTGQQPEAGASETGTSGEGSVQPPADDAGDDGGRLTLPDASDDAADPILPIGDSGPHDAGTDAVPPRCAPVTDTFEETGWTPALHDWMPGGAAVHPVAITGGGAAARFTFNDMVSVLERKHDPTCAFTLTMKVAVDYKSAAIAQDVISLDFAPSNYHFRMGFGIGGFYYVSPGQTGYSATATIAPPGGWKPPALHDLVVTVTSGKVGFTLDQTSVLGLDLGDVGGVEYVTVGNIVANTTGMLVDFDSIVIQ